LCHERESAAEVGQSRVFLDDGIVWMVLLSNPFLVVVVTLMLFRLDLLQEWIFCSIDFQRRLPDCFSVGKKSKYATVPAISEMRIYKNVNGEEKDGDTKYSERLIVCEYPFS